jgi:hypothetical protein
LIDAIGGRSAVAGGVEWNRFSIFFAAAAVSYFIAFILARRLEEPDAATMESLLRELLIESPQRFWLRLWPRA